MVISCNAKINIGLEILNQRDDNYHNINTIFHKICISDKLIIENNKNFEFIFKSHLKISNKDNLAFKAAGFFKKIYNFKNLPVKITLEKYIPTGAGLGGGSSDAANVLRGLAGFFNLPIEKEKFLAVAIELGADVPFFLIEDNSAIARGRGEILHPFNIKFPYYILLVMPELQVSTASAYKSLNRDKIERLHTDYSSLKNILLDNSEKMKDVFKNDFESSVFLRYPELRAIKLKLYETGAFFAQMSGSGSSIYGFFREKDEVEKAVEKFSEYKTHICLPH